jgi:hypothetical protein
MHLYGLIAALTAVGVWERNSEVCGSYLPKPVLSRASGGISAATLRLAGTRCAMSCVGIPSRSYTNEARPQQRREGENQPALKLPVLAGRERSEATPRVVTRSECPLHSARKPASSGGFVKDEPFGRTAETGRPRGLTRSDQGLLLDGSPKPCLISAPRTGALQNDEMGSLGPIALLVYWLGK